MAQVHFVKKARKPVPGTDIQAGESYYWWQHRYGPKRASKEMPKRSMTTQSAFYSTLWDIEDDMIGKMAGDDATQSECEDIAGALRELASECQDSLDNMPEGLQQGDTGQMLQERVDGLEAAADEFESIDFDDREDGEKDADFWQRKCDEAQQISIDVP